MLKLWVREGKEIFIFRNIIHMWASKTKLLLVNLFLLFINIVQIHYLEKEKEAYKFKSLNLIIQMKINFLDYIVDRNQNLLFSSCCFLVRKTHIAKELIVLSFLWHGDPPIMWFLIIETHDNNQLTSFGFTNSCYTWSQEKFVQIFKKRLFMGSLPSSEKKWPTH